LDVSHPFAKIPPLFDEAMDLVEQRWNTLDLIQNHPALRRQGCQLTGEQGWISQQVLIQGLVQQIEATGWS